jgi:ABC-type polysaccharide/polyol phosphate transport system ATPase subunit
MSHADFAISVERLGKVYHLAHTLPGPTLSRSTQLCCSGAVRRFRSFGTERTLQSFGAARYQLHGRTGEVVGIVGRNGAGKSTLLKIFVDHGAYGRPSGHARPRCVTLEVGTWFHPS